MTTRQMSTTNGSLTAVTLHLEALGRSWGPDVHPSAHSHLNGNCWRACKKCIIYKDGWDHRATYICHCYPRL